MRDFGQGRIRLGRTISGERESAKTEAERFREERKKRRGKIIKGVGFFVVILIIIGLVVILVRNSLNKEPEIKEENEVLRPKTAIVESTGKVTEVSEKIKQFVVRLEQELTNHPELKLWQVILPEDKIRELHLVFNEDEQRYVKVSLMRSPAEIVEDLLRMSKYLKDKQLKYKEYLDLRLPGRAYYK